MFSYVTEGVGELFHRQVAKRGLAEQALAVMGYRSRTGHWPAALVDAGKVTMDPFDGKPLRYVRRSDGFVVYSIGVDGKDDRGGKGDEVFEFPAK